MILNIKNKLLILSSVLLLVSCNTTPSESSNVSDSINETPSIEPSTPLVEDNSYDVSADPSVSQCYITEEEAMAKWGNNADEYKKKIKNAEVIKLPLLNCKLSYHLPNQRIQQQQFGMMKFQQCSGCFP